LLILVNSPVLQRGGVSYYPREQEEEIKRYIEEQGKEETGQTAWLFEACEAKKATGGSPW
jgi:hypothetical protein